MDLRERTLSRAGEPLSLKPKEFDLLQVLVAKPGKLVTKEEILAAVWPETVVEESNLSVHISSLRRALGDSAAEPVYIETVPRSGYRFRAAVSEVAVSEVAVSPPAANSRFRLVSFSALFLAFITGAGWWFTNRTERRDSFWKATPLTASPGREVGPALSPDGSQVLYSVRARTADGKLDRSQMGLWLKNLASGTDERLTADLDFNPAWSPDGREIAFVRFVTNPKTDEDMANLVVRSAFGGGDRVVRALNYVGGLPGPGVQYTSDGQWILTSLGTGLLSGTPPAYLVAISVRTGETRRLLEPLPGSSGDFNPAISPGGDRLIFSRCLTGSACDLYTARVDGLRVEGRPARVTDIPSDVFRPLFLPDNSVLCSLGPSDSQTLWRTTFDFWGGHHSEQISPSEEDAVQPSVARLPDGRWRLAYVRNMVDLNIWRVELDGVDGKVIASAPLINSTRIEQNPAYSPDGSRIAVASNRGGPWEIWTCAVTGLDCRQLTRMGPSFSQAPSWSPSGLTLAFDSRPKGQAQIFTVPATGSPSSGTATAFTPDGLAGEDPVWSGDGHWLYFTSNRTGRFEIYRASTQRAFGGQVEPVTTTGGRLPRLSPAGDALVYRGPDRKYSVMNLKDRTQVELPSDLGLIGSPILVSSTLGYAYRVVDRRPFLCRFSVAAGTAENLLPLATLSRYNTLVRSPNGRQLLFVKNDRDEADLMVVDDIRR
ncbi:MAG: winged helix-turn-helix domain-containing protein [Bryobacteraceae bacterium]|nr:winged helix-turn-helix domain-containing protein [Bryobacteraceae bacterium]